MGQPSQGVTLHAQLRTRMGAHVLLLQEPRTVKSRLLAVLVVIAVPLVAGCGSSSSGSGTGTADPAAIVPSTAPLYVDISVRPSGKKGDDAKAAAQKLLQTNDPASKAQSLISVWRISDGAGNT